MLKLSLSEYHAYKNNQVYQIFHSKETFLNVNVRKAIIPKYSIFKKKNLFPNVNIRAAMIPKHYILMDLFPNANIRAVMISKCSILRIFQIEIFVYQRVNGHERMPHRARCTCTRSCASCSAATWATTRGRSRARAPRCRTSRTRWSCCCTRCWRRRPPARSRCPTRSCPASSSSFTSSPSTCR